MSALFVRVINRDSIYLIAKYHASKRGRLAVVIKYILSLFITRHPELVSGSISQPDLRSRFFHKPGRTVLPTTCRLIRRDGP
jgi:hypothetical protein